MRKKLIAGAVALLCLTMLGYSTIAYFTAEDTATNVITSGNIQIQLQETAITEDGETVLFQDSQERFDVVPGQSVSKIVTVQNTGENDAYIRIKIQKQIDLAEGVTGPPDTGLLGLDINKESWTEKEGFYYYNKPLSPGAVTEPLFETVIFDASMNNLYQNSTALIEVTAYATQVDNNGADVMEARGWPAVR